MTMATRFALLAAALFAGAAGHDLRGSTVSRAEFDGTLDALEETISDISPEDVGLARMLTDNVTETTETATLTATTATVTATTTTLEETTTADANATVGETTTTPDAGSTVASTTSAQLPVDGSFRQASVSAGLCALITAAFLAKQL